MLIGAAFRNVAERFLADVRAACVTVAAIGARFAILHAKRLFGVKTYAYRIIRARIALTVRKRAITFVNGVVANRTRWALYVRFAFVSDLWRTSGAPYGENYE